MTQAEMDERIASYAAAADMLKSLVDEWHAERAHADRLAEALRKFMWAAAPENHGGTSAYPYEELRDILALHGARRSGGGEVGAA